MLQDLRLAFRLLRRTPGLTAIAVLSIALGVGASAVVFAAIKAVLIDPLPYARPGELVQLRTEIANAGPSHADWTFWNDVREVSRRNRTLLSVAAYGNVVFDLDGSPPEALYGLGVSANLFPTLGVSPMLGRNILPEEDQTENALVMILSYGLWTRRFNRNPSVVGRHVTVNGRDCLIIGVMPPGFNFPLRRAAAHTPSPYVEFWSALRMNPQRDHGALGAVARLRPGVSVGQAQQDIASIGEELRTEFPATNRDCALRLGLLRDRMLGSAGSALWLLMGGAILFLLVGCANVANLLLARGVHREREMVVRTALGASRARIVRQLITESGVLAVLGGAGGYLVTVVAWRTLPAITPVNVPRLAAARADGTVLAFALVVAVVSAVVFGTMPALRAARTAAMVSRTASGQRDRLRGSLVMAEVAVTITLVVIGGQLLTNFIGLRRTDPGFDADRVVASVVLPAMERYRTPEERRAVYRRFLDAVKSLPGVETAGTVDALPFSGENHGGFITADPAAALDPSRQSVAEVDVVGGQYLQAMGVRLIEGRWFRDEEMGVSSDVAMVSDAAAARLWPGASAIGKRLCVFCTPENPNNWKRVIGVVSGLHHAALDEPPGASVYLAGGALEHAAFLVVRVDRPSADLTQAIRRAVASVDPSQPVLLSASMQTLIADSVAYRRFITSLLVVTAALALLMSLGGVYGVTAYTTSRRTQEIGIRMALGASSGNVHALMFRQTFTAVAAGAGGGLLMAVAAGRILRGSVTGLETQDVWNVWVAAALVVATALVACWFPARRATKVDPMNALRDE